MTTYQKAAAIVFSQVRAKKYYHVLVIEQCYGWTWEQVGEYLCNCHGEAYDPVFFKHEYKEFQRTGWATRKYYKRVKNILNEKSNSIKSL